MKLMQCFPSQAIRAEILAKAEAAGVPAFEEGICIHFDTVRNWEELSQVLGVLKSNRQAAQDGSAVQIIEYF